MSDRTQDLTTPDSARTAERFGRACSEHPVDTRGVQDWLDERAECQRLTVSRIPFSELDQWYFHPDDGRLAHRSGRFFSIEGLEVTTSDGWRRNWIQPIIVQPEVGLLGVVVRQIDGVLHALVQAKAEPGNINSVQLSPTVQATRSNFTGVHQGKSVRLIEYFDGTWPSRILVDVLQSEQGGWFLRKRNRNIVVEIFEDVPEHPNFRWLTIAELRAMLYRDNVVNMDLRTVLACIPTRVEPDAVDDTLAGRPESRFETRLLHSMLGPGSRVHNMNSLLSWISDMRTRREFTQRVRPLAAIESSGWRSRDDVIEREDEKHFTIFGVSVSTSDREITSWTQPLLSPSSHGLLALLVKNIDGTLHALVQMRTEAGAFDVAELAPTVHCQPHNYADAPAEFQPPYLAYVQDAPRSQVRYDAWHSEEGGRFYRNQNRYVLLEVPEDFDDSPTPDYRWMTFDQITYLLGHSHYVNIQLRTIVACAAAVQGRAAG